MTHTTAREFLSNKVKHSIPEWCSLFEAVLWATVRRPPFGDDHLWLSRKKPFDQSYKKALKKPETSTYQESLFLLIRDGKIKIKAESLGEEKPQGSYPAPKIQDYDDISWHTSIIFPHRKDAAMYVEVFVEDLLQAFPPEHYSPDIELLSGSPKSIKIDNRGRPREYDREKIYLHILAKTIIFGGLSKKRSELKLLIESFCEDTWGKPPGDTLVNDMVTTIQGAIALTGK